MKKYKWLLFDADGTLFDFEKAESIAFTNTMKSFSVEPNEELFLRYKSINGALWKLLESGDITTEEIKVKRFSTLISQINLNANPNDMAKAYHENLAECDFLFDETESVIETLSKFFKLAIVTNGLKEVQVPRFKKSSIRKYFSEIIISDEIGVAKPETSYFDIVFERIGRPPKSETVIIGDSLLSDIKGGNNYGIDTIWYNPYELDIYNPIKITHTIKSLTELLNILM